MAPLGGKKRPSVIGADLLSIFVLNIPRIFFNIAIFFLENFNLALHYN